MVDDVDVADGWATEHQGEANMPVGLGASAEDSESPDCGALEQEAGGGEGGAK